MIKRLQRKFVLISTFALIIVLLTIIGSITSIAYYRAKTEVNNVLTMLINNDGKLPTKHVQKRQNSFLQSRFSREGMFQYRYFSAKITNGGDDIHINNQHILTVQPDTIARLARQLSGSRRTTGIVFYNGTNYAYKIKRTARSTKIVFLDESLLMSESNEILRVGIAIGTISLVLYTLILAAFSKRAIRPIIEAERRQREFIANAGHELKTPLTVIEANTEMQEMTNGENEWTENTKAQIQRLTRLINNLVSLARMGEQPDFKISTVDVSAVTKKVVDSFQVVAQQNHQQLHVNIQKGLTAQAEEYRFEELINILLDNANKYCDPHGVIQLTLNKARRSKAVNLTVANSYANGKNVDYHKFFERFYRADTSHQIGKKSGFGIGLAMALQIVTAFRGKIKANYKKGMISFHVTLRS